MQRSRTSRLIAALAAPVVVAAPLPAASANARHALACAHPDGSVAPVDGWTPLVGSDPTTGSVNNNQCASGLGLQAQLGGPNQPANQSFMGWMFSAPAGTSIAGGGLSWLGWSRQNSFNASPDAWVASPDGLYLSTDVLIQCAYGLGCTNGLSAWVPLPTGAQHTFVFASCGGVTGYVCSQQNGQAVSVMARSDILLEDDASPSITNVAGSAIQPGVHSGTIDVSFTASQPTSGIYDTYVVLDGKVISDRAPVDANGGKCVNRGSSDGWLAFDYVLPCPAQLSIDDSLQTASLTDGQHSLRVAVRSSALTDATVWSGTITTANHTHPSALGEGTAAAPRLPRLPNGSPAVAQARIVLASPVHVASAFSRSPLTLHGRLMSADGRPIASAAIDLLQSVAGTDFARIDQVTSAADGSFAVAVPAGPSRTLRLAYRAFSTDQDLAASADVVQAVRAGVLFHVTPRHARTGQRVRLSGRVLGGTIPAHGKVIDLESFHARTGWHPFVAVRTDARGRFTARYPVHPAGRFRVRATAPAEQGWPYATGHSRRVRLQVA